MTEAPQETDGDEALTGPATKLILEEIEHERARQKFEEGFGPVHDDAEHSSGELLNAAVCYLIKGGEPTTVEQMRAIDHFWPWGAEWWKPKSRRRDIVRALALGVAELERMDRAEAKVKADKDGPAVCREVDGDDEAE